MDTDGNKDDFDDTFNEDFMKSSTLYQIEKELEKEL